MLLTCIHAPFQACSAAIGESKKHLQKVMQGLSEIFQPVEGSYFSIERSYGTKRLSLAAENLSLIGKVQ